MHLPTPQLFTRSQGLTSKFIRLRSLDLHGKTKKKNNQQRCTRNCEREIFFSPWTGFVNRPLSSILQIRKKTNLTTEKISNRTKMKKNNKQSRSTLMQPSVSIRYTERVIWRAHRTEKGIRHEWRLSKPETRQHQCDTINNTSDAYKLFRVKHTHFLLHHPLRLLRCKWKSSAFYFACWLH